MFLSFSYGEKDLKIIHLLRTSWRSYCWGKRPELLNIILITAWFIARIYSLAGLGEFA